MTTASLSDTRQCSRLSSDLVADARLVLADLDGCLMSDGRVFPDTPAFVEACADRLWIVSNNSTHTAEGLSAELALLGLAVDADRILLAGEQTLHHLRDQMPRKTVTLFASDSLQARARMLGLTIDAQAPDIVVLCRDLGFAIPDMEYVIAQCRRGAQLWVSNTDFAHPGLDGRPVPETGALVAALRAVVGHLPFECLGKPSAHMAQRVFNQTRVAPQDAIFLGDNAVTDGSFARAAGLRFVHLVRERAA